MSSANVHETVAVRFVSLRVCLISAPLRLGHPLPLVPAQVSSHRLSPNLFSPLHLLLNIQNRSPLMKVLSTVSYQADKTISICTSSVLFSPAVKGVGPTSFLKFHPPAVHGPLPSHLLRVRHRPSPECVSALRPLWLF